MADRITAKDQEFKVFMAKISRILTNESISQIQDDVRHRQISIYHMNYIYSNEWQLIYNADNRPTYCGEGYINKPWSINSVNCQECRTIDRLMDRKVKK